MIKKTFDFQFYFTIYSLFLSVYLHLHQTSIKKLNTSYKQIIKRLYNLHPQTPTSELFLFTKLPDINSILIKSMTQLGEKISLKALPETLLSIAHLPPKNQSL